jgi:hypothetical protein
MPLRERYVRRTSVTPITLMARGYGAPGQKLN